MVSPVIANNRRLLLHNSAIIYRLSLMFNLTPQKTNVVRSHMKAVKTKKKSAHVKASKPDETPSRKASEPDKVDAYMQQLKHPLADVVEALRRLILSVDGEIGEEIKWNAPTFFYTGEMAPFDPKEYERYIVVFNLHQKNCIRLVFPKGARVNDKSGLLEGDYADGRRLAMFSTMEDVRTKRASMERVIKKWLETLDKG